MASAEQEHELEEARTQILVREINERVFERDAHRGADVELLCECAKKECGHTFAITRDDYERVRRVPTHFLVLPGHDSARIERVVARTDAYLVVEKFGRPGVVAVKLDPRARRGTGDHPRHPDPARTS